MAGPQPIGDAWGSEGDGDQWGGGSPRTYFRGVFFFSMSKKSVVIQAEERSTQKPRPVSEFGFFASKFL